MGWLSESAFERAEAALYRYCRELDIAHYEYNFCDAPAEAVLTELQEYQNDDGGFGHAIEPDFRQAASSPLATSVGLQYATELGLPGNAPIVAEAMGYLKNTYHRDAGYWPATFANVTEAPHAPWWHIEAVTPPAESEWANPSAELLGYCWQWRDQVPAAFLDTVTQRAMRTVRSQDILGNEVDRRYAILCWERSLPHLPGYLHSMVSDALGRTIAAMDITEAVEELYAFSFAFAPTTTVYRHHPELVEDLLRDSIGQQAADGGWWPTWEWGQYPDGWDVAEREWVGKLTLECLHTLKRFDQLPGG